MTGYFRSMRMLARHGATAPARPQGFGPPQPPVPAAEPTVAPMVSQTAGPLMQTAMAPITPSLEATARSVEASAQNAVASEPSAITTSAQEMIEPLKRSVPRKQNDQKTNTLDLTEPSVPQREHNSGSNTEPLPEILRPPSPPSPVDTSLESPAPAIGPPAQFPDVPLPNDLVPPQHPGQMLQRVEGKEPTPSASVGPKPIAAKSETDHQLADAVQDAELNVSAPPFAQAGVPNQRAADPSQSFERIDARPSESFQSYPEREPDRVKLGPAKSAQAAEPRVDVHIGKISIDLVPDAPVAPAPLPRRSVKSAPGQGIYSGQRDLARSYVRRL